MSAGSRNAKKSNGAAYVRSLKPGPKARRHARPKDLGLGAREFAILERSIPTRRYRPS